MSAVCAEIYSPDFAPERRATAERLITQTERISVAPPVAFQILSALRDDSLPSEAVVDLVRLDPDLTAQLLRLCNSAECRGNGITSLKEATLRLGTGVVAQKAMSLTLGRLLDVPVTDYCPDPKGLWRHSVQTALVARYLAPYCRGQYNPETSFTAGLLHDLGKLVINSGAPDELGEIATLRWKKRLPFAEAEFEVLGSDHAEIGGLILERWKLPDLIVAGVRYHHAPKFDCFGMANLVHVAEACGKLTKDPASWSDFENAVQASAIERLDLNYDYIKDCWEEMIRDTRALESYLN